MRLRADYLSQRLCQHRGERGLVRKELEETTADYDNVAYGEQVESGSSQHTTAHSRFDVKIVCNLQIIHDGIQGFVHFASGSEKARSFECREHVVLGLGLPLSLCLHGRLIALFSEISAVVYPSRCVYNQIAELLPVAGFLEVVAPESRLCLKAQMIKIVDIFDF